STADYDTFQNITIEGPLTVDVDNVGGIGHILCGTWTPTYSHLQRVNLLNWRIRHVRIINAPVTTDNGVTNHRLGIWFTVYQPGAAETRVDITDWDIDDVQLYGGDGLIGLNGSGPVGNTVYIDRVSITNWVHDPGVVPAVGMQAMTHVQIGSIAIGGSDIYIGNGWARYSGDDGIEINAVQHCLVENVVIEDSWNEAFYLRNFNTPLDEATQCMTFRNCHARRVNQTANPMTGWKVFPDGTVGANPTAIELVSCSWYRNTPDTPFIGEAVATTYVTNLGPRRVVIR